MPKFNFRAALVVAILLLTTAFFVDSCTKTSDSAVSQFVGTWTGTGCYSTTYTISTGPTNYSMYLGLSIGSDTCLQTISMLGSVSSDAATIFSMETQHFVDKCGNNYSISGGGSIVGDSIFITTYTQSSISATPTACTFKGIK